MKVRFVNHACFIVESNNKMFKSFDNWLSKVLKTKKEFTNMKLANPVNEGWLFSKDKHSIKLFAAYIEEDGSYTYGDRTNIPTSWIVKMTKI